MTLQIYYQKCVLMFKSLIGLVPEYRCQLFSDEELHNKYQIVVLRAFREISSGSVKFMVALSC